ncbi:AAA family ATPase [Paeniglutamicibacter sp. R2-26]|uniref:AAA family ATPase n=1 Tax=Paeniglutamicibacter sp. R2-26 TaxID=3144417 RepID=UPI003EE510F9
MTKVLLTGMSGSGKSSVLLELHSRGHETLDTDYGGWVLEDGTWDEPRMDELLRQPGSMVVSGTVENQGRFYGYFEHVVLLSAPLSVLLQRVRSRTTNEYGKSEAQQSEIANFVETVEPLLRNGASMELDGRLPVSLLADAIEELLS